MNIKFTIRTLKPSSVFLKICYVALILAVLAGIVYFIAYFAYEQYIIDRTEKTYNMLKDAYAKTVKTSNLQWENGKMSTVILANAFLKNLPVEKNCEYTNNGKCFASRVYFTKEAIRRKGVSLRVVSSYKVLLKDGTAIAFRNLSPTCDLSEDRCGEIYIDANGPYKGPNQFGRDIFDFEILKDRIELYDIRGNHFPNCVYGGGHCCGAYLFQFRNRNYKSYRNYVKRHHIEFVNFSQTDD